MSSMVPMARKTGPARAVPGRQKWKFESVRAYAQMALTDAEDIRETTRSPFFGRNGLVSCLQ